MDKKLNKTNMDCPENHEHLVGVEKGDNTTAKGKKEKRKITKTERNILVAFILNSVFSIFEFVGGILTGSISIVSDAIHDLGDASSIGLAFFLERKSARQPEGKYSYGYLRYSVLASAITTIILLLGSGVVIYNAIMRIINPVTINYDGMLIIAGVGLGVNLVATLVTHRGHSLNQKAINLHMLEDVIGWVVVLVGAVIMRFTDFALIDPILSIGMAVFILVSALKNLKSVLDVFLEKCPKDIDEREIVAHLNAVEGVLSVHHVHIWTMNGTNHYATLHAVTEGDTALIKHNIREELAEHGITHVTIETELPTENCSAHHCHIETAEISTHRHHHHHH